ncbi:hypothetical protein AB0M12_19530 [Nocardia vinacea]|uniref:hypothetical protein n=1 Tax=Nocardia vinacea TaxID=96468 RepID=UPI0034407743
MKLAYDTDMSRFRLACVAAPVHGPSGEIVAALAATVAEVQQIPAVTEAVKRAVGWSAPISPNSSDHTAC